MKFAANLSFLFQELDFTDRFAAARKAGFSAVEMLFPYDLPPESLKTLLTDNELVLALFNLPPGDWQAGDRGMAAISGRQSEFAASVQQALDRALELGVTRLHMMAGNADPRDRDARATYLENLRLAASRAIPHGIEIMIEPINTRDMPGYFLNDFDLAETLIREAGLPNVRLQFDIYHRQIMCGDVTRGLERLMPLIGHVQVASVPDRTEPGRGELDDLRIFETLHALGYAGYVGCEYRPEAGTAAGLGWFRQALAALSQDLG